MYLECAVNSLNSTRFSWDRVKNAKSILVNEKQDRNFRQTQYLLQIWGRNVQSIKEQTSAGRCTQARGHAHPADTTSRFLFTVQMNSNTAHSFYLLNFHINTLTDKLSACYQGNCIANLAQKSWQVWLAWVTWRIEPPGRLWHHDYTTVSPVQQLHSKHDILQRPSSEKPCVQYKSPHSCFIEKINVVSSQQSLYVISRREMWCNITAWVMSYYW